MKRIVLTTMASAALMASASAATYSITDMEVIPGSYTTLNVGEITPDAPNAIAGLIELTTTTGSILPVFCIDLFHNFIIGKQSPHLTYVESAVANDSSGALSNHGVALSAEQISAMQSIANLGYTQFTTGESDLADKLIADQGAIWGIEYDADVTSTDSHIENLIQWASIYGQEAKPLLPGLGLYSAAGVNQGFIEGGLTPSVPEPSTWAMMAMGFLTLAFMGVRKRVRVQS